MSVPFYSYDPCVETGCPCGACLPYSNRVEFSCRCRGCRGNCCTLPGGGCSPCPPPVCPAPTPPPPCPVLPCAAPIPPCERPFPCPPPPCPLCRSVAIPSLRPNRCVPCPRYCVRGQYCKPLPCNYPGAYACGPCGACMPIR